MTKSKELAKIAAYALTAGAVVFVLYIMFGGNPQTAAAPAPTATPKPTLLATPTPTAAPCINGTKREFACVGEISGIQTYYECESGHWVSKSQFNKSGCVKIFGGYNPWEDNATNGTLLGNLSANSTGTVID